MITVTDRAAGKIRQLAAREQRADPVLRVRVVAGGCSGFSYELSFADAPAEDDHVIAAAEGVPAVTGAALAQPGCTIDRVGHDPHGDLGGALALDLAVVDGVVGRERHHRAAERGEREVTREIGEDRR